MRPWRSPQLSGAWPLALAASLLLGSCASVPLPAPSAPPTPAAPSPASAFPAPANAGTGVTGAASATSPPSASAASPLPMRPASFQQLPGWQGDDFAGLWQAWRRDCSARVALLAGACAASSAIADADIAAQRRFFEQWFQPWELLAPSGSRDGLVTGYYEPVFAGSSERAWPYVVPVWGPPDGLVDLPAAAPGAVRRGLRIDAADGSGHVEPFWSRAQIDQDPQAQQLLARHVVAWLQSPVDALFLQVQGSGLVRMPDGSLLRLGYAGDNGWPYQSVGRWLLDQGDLRGTVTMQIIRAWAQLHPERVPQMLEANPRVVFFRATPLDDPGRGPVGALGVPLTAMRSVAVDKSLLALGMPLWLSTRVQGQPLQRLVFAQDVGGAIRGALRADLFFGTGDAAGDAAGRMQASGSMWLLLPRGGVTASATRP